MTASVSDPMPSVRWCGRFLFIWLLIRTLLWLMAIIGSHPNGPLDLIEWLSWGHSLQWGYPKHPPLPAWLAAGFARLSPGDVWGVYVLGYLSAAMCFAAAWQLGKRYLPPPIALCAALSLEGLMYLTNDPAEWSNNVALAVGWAWTIVLGEKAVRINSIGSWLAVGVVIGLTLLCKYTLGVLLLPLIVYLVWNQHGRRCLRTPGPYLAVVVAMAVFAPHSVWMAKHDFVTLKYAVERSESSDPLGRLINPLAFIGGQLLWLLPVGVVLLPWFVGRIGSPYPVATQPPSPSETVLSEDGGRGLDYFSPLPPSSLRTVSEGEGSVVRAELPKRSDLGFLHFAVVGPVVVLLLLSVTTGCQLREIWGSPLWTFFGVWVLVVGRATWRRVAFRRSLILAGVIGTSLLTFTVVKQMSGPYLLGKPHRPHFPGQALAAEVNARWHARFPTAVPFPIVAGEAWAAGNICCYSRHRPVLFSSGNMGALDFDPALSPWTSDIDLATRGGVVVWDATQLGDSIPPQVQARFPMVLAEPVVELRHRTGADIAPVRIGLALVPPAGG